MRFTVLRIRVLGPCRYDDGLCGRLGFDNVRFLWFFPSVLFPKGLNFPTTPVERHGRKAGFFFSHCVSRISRILGDIIFVHGLSFVQGINRNECNSFLELARPHPIQLMALVQKNRPYLDRDRLVSYDYQLLFHQPITVSISASICTTDPITKEQK